MQDQSPLAHVLPLSRSPLTIIHAQLIKHAQCTSKSSSSRRLRFLLLSGLALSAAHCDGTLALVEVLFFAWFSDIVSPFAKVMDLSHLDCMGIVFALH